MPLMFTRPDLNMNGVKANERVIGRHPQTHSILEV